METMLNVLIKLTDHGNFYSKKKKNTEKDNMVPFDNNDIPVANFTNLILD